MPDFTLSDGREITIDLYKITVSEYDQMFDEKKDEVKNKEFMTRTFGMSADEFDSLPMPDGVMLQRLFWKKCSEIFKEPKNSQSVPSSP